MSFYYFVLRDSLDGRVLLISGILAYSRSRNFFYLYYVLRTLTAVVCEGSVHCLALAYVVSLVPDLSVTSSAKPVPACLSSFLLRFGHHLRAITLKLN